jgi:hypothetical protein
METTNLAEKRKMALTEADLPIRQKRKQTVYVKTSGLYRQSRFIFPSNLVRRVSLNKRLNDA